jgi:hypothetical protein
VAVVATVIGREFEFGLLQGAAGLSPARPSRPVEELPPSLQVLHREVVSALEAVPSGDEHVERLAHHALRGDLREKAVPYLPGW